MMCRSVILALASAAMGASLLIPQPDGPFHVTMSSQELVDSSRQDPFNSSHPRRLMISRFTPVPEKRCIRTCEVEYMPDIIAREEDANLLAFLSTDEWPAGMLGELKLQLCCEAQHPAGCKLPSFPKLLFGTGKNTTRLFYSAIAQNIASAGYEVIVMDHPYETDIVQFPDGTVIYGGRVGGDNNNNTEPLLHALDVRTRDATFILKQLGVPYPNSLEAGNATTNSTKVGMLGQSFGGAAAAALMLNDTRVVAGVNFDGFMYGPVLNAGLGRPGIPQSFLIWGAEEHNYTNEPSWARLWETHDKWDPAEWMKELSLKDSLHGSFWDMVIIADVASLRQNEEMTEWFYGKITGKRVFKIVREYLDDYFGMTLRGKEEGLLVGPSVEFSEVQFIR